MSRVSPLSDDELDDAAKPAFESFVSEGRDPIALYRVLANAPAFLDGFHQVGAAIRYRSELDRALVELVILRISALTQSRYEWNHHHGMALRAGVDRAKIDAVGEWAAAPASYTEPERAALLAADAVHEIAMTDATFDGLLAHFTTRQATEIVALAAHYEGVARVLQALDVDIEAEYTILD
ncbi:MAG TPA: carboxymuconolactone decarboxylase family protein [Galbitalea sp.]|jgi:alkylhydroperoxidase family enzyme